MGEKHRHAADNPEDRNNDIERDRPPSRCGAPDVAEDCERVKGERERGLGVMVLDKRSFEWMD
jgi:hypothetical protein